MTTFAGAARRRTVSGSPRPSRCVARGDPVQVAGPVGSVPQYVAPCQPGLVSVRRRRSRCISQVLSLVNRRLRAMDVCELRGGAEIAELLGIPWERVDALSRRGGQLFSTSSRTPGQSGRATSGCRGAGAIGGAG